MTKRIESPPILYHYTKTSAFDGIVKSGQLWLSSPLFANDRSEYDFGLATALSSVKQKWFEKTPGKAAWNYYEMRRSLGKQGVFAASLTELGNSLSQWRGYCREGGFSLGFDFEHLRKASQVQGMTLRKILYSNGQPSAQISDSIDEEIEIEIQKGTNTNGLAAGSDWHVHNTIHSVVSRMAVFIKHEGFAEESEWRIHCSMATASKDHVQIDLPLIEYRPGIVGMIPFVRFSMFPESSDLDRTTVLKGSLKNWLCYCGPGLLELDSVSAVEFFLGSCGHPGKVKRSGIPYRDA